MKVGDEVRVSLLGKDETKIGKIVKLHVPIKSHKDCDPCDCGVTADIDGESWTVHRNFVEPVTTTRRTCMFIEVNNTNAVGTKIKSIFVPRPTSWLGGWARHQWLKEHFKQECTIASPDFWKLLVERHGDPKILVEKWNGDFYIMEGE